MALPLSQHCSFNGNFAVNSSVTLMAHSKTRRKMPKNLRYPRLAKLPPDLGTNLFFRNSKTTKEPYQLDTIKEGEEEGEEKDEGAYGDDIVWENDEIEALFQGRIPQKPGKLNRERSLPLPLPYKNRHLRLPTLKKHTKMASMASFSSREALSKQVYKSPGVLIGLAREIKSLPAEEDVCLVLNKWAQFLQRGSLLTTIRVIWAF